MKNCIYSMIIPYNKFSWVLCFFICPDFLIFLRTIIFNKTFLFAKNSIKLAKSKYDYSIY